MTHRRMRGVVVALVAALGLAACTGVPSSSQPSIVAPVDIAGGTDAQQPGPTPGSDPRTVVQGFLAANADPSGHDTARKFLAPTSRDDWSDATATIITSQPAISNIDRGVVTVTGRVIGSLTQNGVYVPQLQGIGDGGPLETFQYQVRLVGGEYRIVDPPAGLLLTEDQFSGVYRQHTLYFFDLAHRYLVPDPRWSALQGARLDSWLVSQLATGPRPDLTSSLSTDTLPAQATSRRITATDGTPIQIEVPGASQLDGKSQLRLAAQVSATVTEPTSTLQVEITDGGTPVPISDARDTVFTASQFFDSYAPVQPAPDVYFLRNGDIVRENGTALDGKLKDSPYYLSSIAVTRSNAGPDLTVAGVTDNGTLLILGTEGAGYRATTVRGQLSRPAWTAGAGTGATAGSEVWIGMGGQLMRVVVNGNRGTASVVSVNASAGGGRIVALRLSPEGSRIALVIASPDGSQRLFIGAVVRSAGQVRVDSLPVISPQGVSVDDVAWIGPTKVIAIGAIRSTDDPQIFESNVDGSLWTGRPIGSSLPAPPDSVTVAVGQLAWVSSNKTVWEQLGRGWTAPGRGDQTVGDKPVYLE